MDAAQWERTLRQHSRAEGLAETVRLKAGESVTHDDGIYFPMDAVANLTLCKEAAHFQVGFAGNGDVIGIHRLLLPDFPPLGATVMRGGQALRIAQPVLDALLDSDAVLRQRMKDYALRSTARFLTEAANAATLSLEKRVARWIALCREAVGSDEIAVTHQYIATALGVRRSGVTVALHILEGEHIIRSRRGRIQVLDPEALVAYSAEEDQSSPSHPACP